MTNPIRICVSGAAIAADALPSAALAGGKHHGADRGFDASARTEKRVERVELSLEKAVDAIDDGDDAKAATKLAAVDKNLARAAKAAARQLDTDKGPGSFGLVADAADDVALTTADAMDGGSQGLTDSLEGTLDNALSTRDGIVAVVAADEEYEDVLYDVADSSDEEVESFDEGVADDELTDSGKTALTDASAQAAATSTAATAATDAFESTEEEEGTEEEDGEDCPQGHGGPTGPAGPPRRSQLSLRKTPASRIRFARTWLRRPLRTSPGRRLLGAGHARAGRRTPGAHGPERLRKGQGHLRALRPL